MVKQKNVTDLQMHNVVELVLPKIDKLHSWVVYNHIACSVYMLIHRLVKFDRQLIINNKKLINDVKNTINGLLHKNILKTTTLYKLQLLNSFKVDACFFNAECFLISNTLLAQ